MNKIIWVFFSLWLFSNYSVAQENIEGRYDIGPTLFVLPNNNFVMSIVYGGFTGRYILNGDEVSFMVDDLKLPKYYISELKKPISAYDYMDSENSPSEEREAEQYKKYSEIFQPNQDQLLIYFDDGELKNKSYIGINQSNISTKLQKIYDDKDHCLSDEERYILIPRQKDMTIILYQPKNDERNEFVQQYFIPDQINKIMIKANNYVYSEEDIIFKAKVQKGGLLFLSEINGEKDQFIQKNSLEVLSKYDLDFFNAFIKSFRETEKNKDEIFFKNKAVKLNGMIFNNQPLLKKSCSN